MGPCPTIVAPRPRSACPCQGVRLLGLGAPHEVLQSSVIVLKYILMDGLCSILADGQEREVYHPP